MTRIPKSIRSTRQILQGTNHILHSLLTQSRQLVKIEQAIRRFVPDEFAVASLHEGELLLTTASSASATRIRYRQRNILSSLRHAAPGLPVDSIKIRVQPDVKKVEENQEESRFLSERNSHQIAETAKYIEDPALRKALINLSLRTQNQP